MESPFGTLLIALQDRLKAKVPAIRWIDQDTGQLEVQAERPPVSFPCVLIDFENFLFEDAGEAIQFASGTVLLRLAWPPFSQTNNVTPAEWKEKGLAYYDIEWAIYKALHGWKPGATTPLPEGGRYGYMMRVSSETEKRDMDILRVRALRYSITFEDYNASPEYNMAPMPPADIQDE